MGNENLNLLKSVGKNIVNGIVSDLSESGITETLIKNGIPVNKIMIDSSKGKSQVKANANKNQSSNKKKQNKKEEKPEKNKEKERQPVQNNVTAPKVKSDVKERFSACDITAEQLRDAVVWSEILGKPVSRKRRSRGR